MLYTLREAQNLNGINNIQCQLYQVDLSQLSTIDYT